MKQVLPTLAVLLVLAASTQPVHGSPSLLPPPFTSRASGWESLVPRPLFATPFERGRGVSWDGRIAWKTPERAWLFAAALEHSLKEIVRGDSPYRLSVAVIQVEKEKGTFLVEFTVQGASGESLELVQVEGVVHSSPSADEAFRAAAARIVATFEESVLR
jgi:hypothetical protein